MLAEACLGLMWVLAGRKPEKGSRAAGRAQGRVSALLQAAASAIPPGEPSRRGSKGWF
jgi:hypothetical protein